MSTDVHPHHDTGVPELVHGIISDAQRLFGQQLKMLRLEIQEDTRKTREATTLLVAGAGVCLLAGALLALMLAHGLSAAIPSLPLWACYGLVGVVLAVAGGALLYTGQKKFESFNPLPDKTAEALKENVEWLAKNPK